MATEPRRQTADLILTCAETTHRAAQEGTLRAFKPSAQTTTGFTEANVTSAYAGFYVIPDDGSSQGQVRQIKSVLGTTVTLDSPWSSIGSPIASSIRTWQPAEIAVVCTTSDASAPHDVIASAHAGLTNEPDDYWNEKGYMLVCISGANAGRAKQITDFVNATGQFVTGFASAVAQGDVFLLRKMLRPFEPAEVTVSQKFLERRVVGTGSFDAAAPIPITTESSIRIALEQRPLSQVGSSGQLVGPPTEVADLLEDHFTLRRDTGGTVSAADDDEVTATSSVWSVGGFVLGNTGEVSPILAVSSTTLTHIGDVGLTWLTHGSITVGGTAYASASFIRKAQDYRTRMFDVYRGGKLRQVLHGCMPKLTMDIARDQTVKFAFDYMAPEAFEYNVDRPVAVNATYPLIAPDTGIPTDIKGSRVKFDNFTVVLQSLSLDFGFTPIMRDSLSGVNNYDGCMMVPAPVSGRLQIYADQDDLSTFRSMPDRIRRNKPITFLYQKGTAPGSTFAIFIPALNISNGAAFSYNEGQGMWDIPFTCLDPTEAYSSGTAIYPASTYPGLPAISFGWL